MAIKYSKDQLNNLDKEMLITLFLSLQDQYESIANSLDLLQEQVAIMNQRQFGRKSESNLTQDDYSQAQFIEMNGEMVIVFGFSFIKFLGFRKHFCDSVS